MTMILLFLKNILSSAVLYETKSKSPPVVAGNEKSNALFHFRFYNDGTEYVNLFYLTSGLNLLFYA